MELNLRKIIQDKKIIKIITTELLRLIFRSKEKNKEAEIHNYLDNYLKEIDLTESFNNKLILIYDEVLYVEILTALHSWFYTKCCNLKNIVVITTHTLGADDWYQQYTRLNGVPGFTLIEAPLLSSRYESRFNSIPKLENRSLTKKLKYYFSFYGGSYGSLERDFLTAFFASVPGGYVDYLSGFVTEDKEFDNYLEQQTSFLDREFVDFLVQVKNNTTFAEGSQLLNESFDMTGFQYNIDNQSACQVIRETSNTTPYMTLTEKTLRSFIHFQIPLPISGTNFASNLEKLGFVFDHSIIDYNYQTDPIFYNRLRLVEQQIKKLNEDYNLIDLEEYFRVNSEMLCYNYNYIQSGKLFNTIKEKLNRELND